MIILWFILTVQAVRSLPAHITVEGLPKAVTSTFLKTTPGTLKEMSTSEINFNSVDHKLVRALMPFQQEGVRSVFLKMIYYNLFLLTFSYFVCGLKINGRNRELAQK